jgi:pilus assembly protein TadC
VLLAFVAGLLVTDPRSVAGSRLARLREVRRSAPSRTRPRLPPWSGRAVGGVTVLALLTGRGGLAAVLLPLSVVLVVPASRRRRAEEAERVALGRDLPRAADLLATCLEAGATPAAALAVVAEVIGGVVAARLRPVAAALAVGAEPPVPGLADAAATDDPVARLVRALARATATGAPLAASMRDVALDERERARWSALERARRAGVQAVGPLAACFLPAFVLVGVVPVVAGVASALLGGWA